MNTTMVYNTMEMTKGQFNFLIKKMEKAIIKDKEDGYSHIDFELPPYVYNNPNNLNAFVEYIKNNYDPNYEHKQYNPNGAFMGNCVYFKIE